MWQSLRLFSPAQWSSLPGIIMPGGPDYYPTRQEAIDYLLLYEEKYKLNIRRPVAVTSVVKDGTGFEVETSAGKYHSVAIVNTTGTFNSPVYPEIPGVNTFRGTILHSSQYSTPGAFRNKTVAVFGEGNSGAQILAELSSVAQTIWITLKDPTFLPDHIDGRFLFDAATRMYEARKQGKDYTPPSLGQIVMVPPVKAAFARGVFDVRKPAVSEVTTDGLRWADGTSAKVDAIIFCTGFRPNLDFLHIPGIIESDKKPLTTETRSTKVDGMWFVGYGNWTGFASATLIGVGRSARTTVDQVVQYLNAHTSTRLRGFEG
jgi:cation diffusion facilitator CzcD-associated flavoprotein CzcO